MKNNDKINENQEIINEGFYSKDKVLELIKLYKPLIIGDKDFIVEDIEAAKATTITLPESAVSVTGNTPILENDNE